MPSGNMCPPAAIQLTLPAVVLASRGSTVSALTISDLWWKGPQWLALPESAWPVTKIKPLSKLPHQETAATLLAVSTPQPTWELYKKYSSYAHLVRVLSWIRRFINGCRKKLTMECDDKLTYQELAASRHFLITVQQHQQFPEVFESLGKKRNLPDKHPRQPVCHHS